MHPHIIYQRLGSVEESVSDIVSKLSGVNGDRMKYIDELRNKVAQLEADLAVCSRSDSTAIKRIIDLENQNRILMKNMEDMKADIDSYKGTIGRSRASVNKRVRSMTEPIYDDDDDYLNLSDIPVKDSPVLSPEKPDMDTSMFRSRAKDGRLFRNMAENGVFGADEIRDLIRNELCGAMGTKMVEPKFGREDISTTEFLQGLCDLSREFFNEPMTLQTAEELSKVDDLVYADPQSMSCGKWQLNIGHVVIEDPSKYSSRFPNLPYYAHEVAGCIHSILTAVQHIINDNNVDSKNRYKALEIAYNHYRTTCSAAISHIRQIQQDQSVQEGHYGIMVQKLAMQEIYNSKAASSVKFVSWLNSIGTPSASAYDTEGLSTLQKKYVNNFVNLVFAYPAQQENVYLTLREHTLNIIRTRIMINAPAADMEKGMMQECTLMRERAVRLCPEWNTKYMAARKQYQHAFDKYAKLSHTRRNKLLSYTLICNSLLEVQYDPITIAKVIPSSALMSKETYLVQGMGKREQYDQTGKAQYGSKKGTDKDKVIPKKKPDANIHNLDSTYPDDGKTPLKTDLAPIKIRYRKDTYSANIETEGKVWGRTQGLHSIRGEDGGMRYQPYWKADGENIGPPDRHIRDGCALKHKGMCPGGIQFCSGSHLFLAINDPETCIAIDSASTPGYLEVQAKASFDALSKYVPAFAAKGYKTYQEAAMGQEQQPNINLDTSICRKDGTKVFNDLKMGFTTGPTSQRSRGDLGPLPSYASMKYFQSAPQ